MPGIQQPAEGPNQGLQRAMEEAMGILEGAFQKDDVLLDTLIEDQLPSGLIVGLEGLSSDKLGYHGQLSPNGFIALQKLMHYGSMSNRNTEQANFIRRMRIHIALSTGRSLRINPEFWTIHLAPPQRHGFGRFIVQALTRQQDPIISGSLPHDGNGTLQIQTDCTLQAFVVNALLQESNIPLSAWGAVAAPVYENGAPEDGRVLINLQPGAQIQAVQLTYLPKNTQ